MAISKWLSVLLLLLLRLLLLSISKRCSGQSTLMNSLSGTIKDARGVLFRHPLPKEQWKQLILCCLSGIRWRMDWQSVGGRFVLCLSADCRNFTADGHLARSFRSQCPGIHLPVDSRSSPVISLWISNIVVVKCMQTQISHIMTTQEDLEWLRYGGESRVSKCVY